MKKSKKVFLLKQAIQLDLRQKFYYGVGKPKKKSSNEISSIKTMKLYTALCINFANYIINNNKEFKGLKSCKKYVPEFLEYLKTQNYSPSTIRTYANALAKLFSKKNKIVKSTDFGITFTQRKSSNFTKNRLSVEYSKHFSTKNNKKLIRFCKMCGLRRNELEHLKYTNLEENDGCLFLNLDGKYCKHGKPRKVVVITDNQNDIEFFKSFLAMRTEGKKYFGKVHNACRVHRYRAEYAYSLYKRLERHIDDLNAHELYICRGDKKGLKFDRKALYIVSKNLGHNRLGVVVNNYFYTAN